MKRALLLSTLVACVMTTAHAQSLDGTLKKIADTKTITIGHRDSSIPFSYLDDNQKPIGYSMDLCARIVDAVKAKLKLPDLQVRMNPVTSSTRIPLLANGTVDLACGSATNNAERQNQVSFAPTMFITANRFVSKKSANLNSMDDLKGKSVVSTAGTSNIKAITEMNGEKKLGMNIAAAKDHAEAFLQVETGRAAAFFMDDVLLASLVASSKSPKDYVISKEALSVEPYGIILRKNDPQFKKLVDEAIGKVYTSGEINAIYKKWFESPIPPRNINLELPMTPQLKKAFEHPTDSPDPSAYK